MDAVQHAAQSLQPLHQFIGEWQGKGQSFAQPIIAKLSISLHLQQTFLEIREQLYTISGELDYEDRSWISYDDRQNQLVVTQLIVPGIVDRKICIADEHGCRWWKSPQDPIVFLSLIDTHLRLQVKYEEQVLTSIRYQRLD